MIQIKLINNSLSSKPKDHFMKTLIIALTLLSISSVNAATTECHGTLSQDVGFSYFGGGGYSLKIEKLMVAKNTVRVGFYKYSYQEQADTQNQNDVSMTITDRDGGLIFAQSNTASGFPKVKLNTNTGKAQWIRSEATDALVDEYFDGQLNCK
jgi:hypothetical protein